ncbi:MAG TPA: hypothetical protein PKZ72_01790 [Saprospiraceae bacterium]|nr:hypothetical protein [Saprospiraceae bacterium]HMZ74238.1 hypothetical protein [Saprospiraceae bacterium]HNA93413.1 hypothetical protein [Saprospiraceae bacterium]HNE65581.1 hypothetical protein [Saprospiraceae bacterium]HNJ63196.1 hypothetical protein [Saprospiraceae bacterium]
MNIFQDTSRILISCQKMLGTALASEVKALGYETVNETPSVVEIQGTMDDCFILNLHLRTASQVLYHIRSFHAENAEELYQKARNIYWEDILLPDVYFSITGYVNNETVNNSMYANVKLKDAIVDRMREKFNSRPSSGNMLDKAAVHLHWNRSYAEIFVNTSGESLARHGFRKIPGTAPLQEALAAAIILSTKWDQASAFINPMCGSGTLAIEAALVAANIPPGYFRKNYAFMHLKNYNEKKYQDCRKRMLAQTKKEGLPQIVCSDISSSAVHIAKLNARAAGVYDFITFEVCDFRDTTIIPDQAGVVVLNPEYGERLGEVEELEGVYTEIGDFFKKHCTGYTGYVFSGNLDLLKNIGLKPKRKIPFMSAKIECKLMEYELFSGSKKIKEQSVQD